MVFAPVSATVAIAPTTFSPLPMVLLRAVMTLAVPLQVAVPSVNVAVVGAVTPPVPSAVTVRMVPLAMVSVPVKATVAVASLTPLKLDKLQVWPVVPIIDPPEV